MLYKKPIFYSALLLTAVNLILRLVSTSFQVYLSAKIGSAGIGLLQLVLSVGSMATIAGIAGIRTATMYITARELGKKKPENVGHVLSACLLYSIICSTIIAIVFFCLSPIIASKWIGNIGASPAIQLLACFLPVTCLTAVMAGYFTAANRIGTLAIVEILEQFFSISITMIFLIFWAKNNKEKACQSIILGTGISSSIALFTLMLLRLKEKAALAPPFPVTKDLLDTSVPLAVADDLKAGINTAENMIVPKRLALYPKAGDPLAIFGTVCGMVFPVMMFPAAIVYSLAELLMPEMARCNAAGSKIRIQYLTKQSLRLVLIYSTFFSGLMYLLSKPLCIHLYGNNDAGRYLAQYCPMIPMLYCDTIIDAINKGLGQQKVCVKINIATASLDVALLFVLLPRYGMMGYMISFLIVHLINFLLSLRLLVKTTECNILILPTILIMIINIVSCLLCSNITDNLLRLLIFPILFFTMLITCNIINMEDMLWAKSLLKIKHHEL